MSARTGTGASAPAAMPPSDEAVRAAILRMVAVRRKSFCPSEVARGFGPDWRALMPQVRRVAAALAGEGRLAVTQRGRPVAAEAARGPIRLSAPPGPAAGGADGAAAGSAGAG